jgi:hypothetical protein
MLQILNDGLNYLGQYHDKWSGMHRYFIQMSNDLTKALLTDFSAETVEENAIEELENSLQMTSDFCAKMHHCTIGPNARQSFRTSSLHHIIRNATNNALYSPR